MSSAKKQQQPSPFNKESERFVQEGDTLWLFVGNRRRAYKCGTEWYLPNGYPLFSVDSFRKREESKASSIYTRVRRIESKLKKQKDLASGGIQQALKSQVDQTVLRKPGESNSAYKNRRLTEKKSIMDSNVSKSLDIVREVTQQSLGNADNANSRMENLASQSLEVTQRMEHVASQSLEVTQRMEHVATQSLMNSDNNSRGMENIASQSLAVTQNVTTQSLTTSDNNSRGMENVASRSLAVTQNVGTQSLTTSDNNSRGMENVAYANHRMEITDGRDALTRFAGGNQSIVVERYGLLEMPSEIDENGVRVIGEPSYGTTREECGVDFIRQIFGQQLGHACELEGAKIAPFIWSQDAQEEFNKLQGMADTQCPEKQHWLSVLNVMFRTSCHPDGAEQVANQWQRGGNIPFSSELSCQLVAHILDHWKEHMLTFFVLVDKECAYLLRRTGFRGEPFRSMLSEFREKQIRFIHSLKINDNHGGTVHGLPRPVRNLLFNSRSRIREDHPEWMRGFDLIWEGSENEIASWIGQNKDKIAQEDGTGARILQSWAQELAKHKPNDIRLQYIARAVQHQAQQTWEKILAEKDKKHSLEALERHKELSRVEGNLVAAVERNERLEASIRVAAPAASRPGLWSGIVETVSNLVGSPPATPASGHMQWNGPTSHTPRTGSFPFSPSAPQQSPYQGVDSHHSNAGSFAFSPSTPIRMDSRVHEPNSASQQQVPPSPSLFSTATALLGFGTPGAAAQTPVRQESTLLDTGGLNTRAASRGQETASAQTGLNTPVQATVEQSNDTGIANIRCTICHFDIESKEECVKVAPCNDIYHKKCFDAFMARNTGRPECPNCRRPLDGFKKYVFQRVPLTTPRSVSQLGERQRADKRSQEEEALEEHDEEEPIRKRRRKSGPL